jgi:hypothetical protein
LSPVSSRVSRVHPARPACYHPPSTTVIKDIFFPYHTPPSSLFAWHPSCLRASRVTISKSSLLAPLPQHHAPTSGQASHTDRPQPSPLVLHDGFSDISDDGDASASCCPAGSRPAQWPCCLAASASSKASIALPSAGKRGHLVAAWYVCLLVLLERVY